jgi:hypothetical protein
MQQDYSNFLSGLMDTLGPIYWLIFFLPIGIFFGILASVPVLSKKMLEIECHHTRSKVLESYVRKAFGFYLLINLVLTSMGWLFIVVKADIAADHKARVFCSLSGMFHSSLILMECFIFLPLRAYRGWFLVNGHRVAETGRLALPVSAMQFDATLIEEGGTVVWIGGIPGEMLAGDGKAGTVVWVGGIPSELLNPDSHDGEGFGADGTSAREVSNAALLELLNQHGRVTSMTVRAKPGRHKSWAFATFAAEADAEAACAAPAAVCCGTWARVAIARC